MTSGFRIGDFRRRRAVACLIRIPDATREPEAMKNILGIVAFICLAQGTGGILYEITDGWFRWFAAVQRIPFLDGYEIYVCVLLLALGLAVGAASDSVKGKG